MKYRKKVKIIMVPYPAQGHVTPMLKLASALSHHGFEAVVVVPGFIHRRIAPQIDDNIACMSIPDGLDDGTPRDFFDIEAAMETDMPIHFERLVRELDDGGGGVACVVVDLLASWAIAVARRCGVHVAGFWPAMLATYRLIAAIPDMVRLGIISQTGSMYTLSPLASALSHQGFEAAAVVVPGFIHRRIAPQINDNIACMSIPDGLDDEMPPDFFAIEAAMETDMPIHFERLVRALDDGGGGVACVVVGLLASWAIAVARRCGVHVAGFWPAMLATYRLIVAIPDMVRLGIISQTGIPQHTTAPICFEPGQLKLSTEDLPWLIGTSTSRNSRFKFWTRTLDRSRTLPWLLVNTSPEETHDDPHDHPLIFPVGPFIKQVTGINPTFWEEDNTCLDWLDNQSNGSVIYISFGSWVSPIGEGKIKSLAMALEASKRPFIWVLGASWRHGLPCGFLERVMKQGKVVSWAPQMEVLQHRAVGCYLSHCGWNSTVEAIECGKRMVCYPVAGDQFVNCAYVVKVWRVGVRMNGFGEKEVEECVKRVMEDGEMEERLVRVKERIMGKEAGLRVGDNLTAFVHAMSQQIHP